jgi:hypothetical protein
LNIKTVAKFRCGAVGRRGDQWRSEEERRCRLCGEGEETIEH